MIFIDKIRKQKYPTQHYLTLNILFLFENMSNYKVKYGLNADSSMGSFEIGTSIWWGFRKETSVSSTACWWKTSRLSCPSSTRLLLVSHVLNMDISSGGPSKLHFINYYLFSYDTLNLSCVNPSCDCMPSMLLFSACLEVIFRCARWQICCSLETLLTWCSSNCVGETESNFNKKLKNKNNNF